jgi:hypothetical protein
LSAVTERAATLPARGRRITPVIGFQNLPKPVFVTFKAASPPLSGDTLVAHEAGRKLKLNEAVALALLRCSPDAEK